MRRGFSILALALALLLAMTGCSMVQVNEERDGRRLSPLLAARKYIRRTSRTR